MNRKWFIDIISKFGEELIIVKMLGIIYITFLLLMYQDIKAAGKSISKIYLSSKNVKALHRMIHKLLKIYEYYIMKYSCLIQYGEKNLQDITYIQG